MSQDLVTDFVENMERYVGRKKFDNKMLEIEQKLLKRDLDELNKSLLKPLQLEQQYPKIKMHNPFPDLYFENTEKAYVKDTRLQEIQVEVQTHSPFVPQSQNFFDVNANTKLLRDRQHYTLSETAANFSNIPTTSKNPKFLGESKATYPTIILEGKDKHPISTFPNGSSEVDLKKTVSSLGGISDNLRRFGLESVVERNRKTFDDHYKTYSGFMSKKMSMSNTNNFVIDPPVPEVKVEIKNPFVRVPKKFE